MKKRFLFLMFISFTISSYCQESIIGIEAAMGRNFSSISSSKELPEDYAIRDGIGVNLSGTFTVKYSKLSLRNKVGLQLHQFQYEPGTFYTDINGNQIGTFEKTIRNLSSNLSSIVSYDFKSGIYLGIGFNLAYLLSSQYKTSGITVQGKRPEERWITNYQYNKFAVHIPLALGYEWNRNALFVNYFYGLTNRNSREVSIVEKENFLNIGYRLSLSK
ncbi:MAG: hypothetical protein RIC95_09670 [Vicingaceae bacterium]